MKKIKLEYEEKHHIIEVDGIEYAIPQRTDAVEQKLLEHNQNVHNMSEYDGNMSLLGILFGKKNAKRMFPDKETTNLDKLAKCVKMSLAAYRADFNNIMSETPAIDTEQLQSLLIQFEKTLNATSGALRNVKTQRKQGGKR